MPRQIWKRTILALRLLALVSIGTGFLAVAPVAAGEMEEVPLDLAALMLHSDDLIWLLKEQGLLFDDGSPYGMLWSTSHTSVEEAIAAETYATARGGFTFEPGWRWSECVKPVVGTASCQNVHVGYAVSGQIRVRLDDGTESTISAGQSYTIPPGHDAWVEGDETFVGIEVMSAEQYAKPQS